MMGEGRSVAHARRDRVGGMNASSFELVLAVAGGVAALVLLGLALLALRMAGRARRELAALAERLAAVEQLQSGPAGRAADESAPVLEGRIAQDVTLRRDLATGPTTAVEGRIDGRLFADIVAREGLVKAAGVAHGLRRALAPASRNRIRFEMGREVKRSRRQRRVDLKAALRDHQARERRDSEDAA